MLDFYCIFDEGYPEKPDRIKVPYERCQFYGLTDKCINIPVSRNDNLNHEFLIKFQIFLGSILYK